MQLSSTYKLGAVKTTEQLAEMASFI